MSKELNDAFVAKGRIQGLDAVLSDLQNEHTRWEDRNKSLDEFAASNANLDKSIIEAQKRINSAKMDYVELLIRRYKSWRDA